MDRLGTHLGGRHSHQHSLDTISIRHIHKVLFVVLHPWVVAIVINTVVIQRVSGTGKGTFVILIPWVVAKVINTVMKQPVIDTDTGTLCDPHPLANFPYRFSDGGRTRHRH